MDVIWTKFKEVVFSVLPITLIVIILNLTITPLDQNLLIRFIVGAILVIIGLTIFLLGVDIGITPIGENLGTAITKSNKLWILVIAGLIFGFFISIAEPDLQILANQVDSVTGGIISKSIILVVVSIGIAIMLTLGLARIVFSYPLYKLLTITYGVIFILALFVTPEFLAISFDASGATTGALTVPFILGLAMGVSRMKKDSKGSEKDSFGLVGITSTGAILGVMIMSIIYGAQEIVGAGPDTAEETRSILQVFADLIGPLTVEIAIALVPIIVLFGIFQFLFFKMSLKTLRRILFGILFTYVGLILFLMGVQGGFMELGEVLGFQLASLVNPAYVLGVAFVFGMVTILAEPAVSVLTHQIEEVTSGYVKRSIVMVTLSIGVALALTLSILRILVPQIQLWHYLLPGFGLSILMAQRIPKLFVGIAFDSGGVASGPMTATFILAFALGVARAVPHANVLVDGFGLIAMVAMTPIIAIQVLGVVFKLKSKKEGVEHV